MMNGFILQENTSILISRNGKTLYSILHRSLDLTDPKMHFKKYKLLRLGEKMSVYKNTMWSFLSIVGVQIINILTNIILARVLAPEYFGVLGMAMVFAGIAFVIQEAGLSSYLIYNKSNSNKLIYSTFWMNILISAILTALIWGMSPHIANLYKSDQVEEVLKYVCIGIGLGPLEVHQERY